jgi:drug/metabolite transporter (DMT)-like permease
LASGIEPSAGLHLVPALALLYSAIVGTAVAYLFWVDSVAKLPASTASLGALLAPVAGVIASVLMLGDRPSTTDLTGFAMIFVAAVCALVASIRCLAELGILWVSCIIVTKVIGTGAR